jgi:hypothetical protein
MLAKNKAMEPYNRNYSVDKQGKEANIESKDDNK